jgi:alkylation response protein AidB-like acyl-CoA dehydrogenase
VTVIPNNVEPATGHAIVAASLGPLDGSASTELRDGRLTGIADFVATADAGTHLAVVVGQTLAVVPLGAPGVTAERVELLGGAGLHRVHLDQAAVLGTARLRVPSSDLLALARLGVIARSLGAAEHAFELAVDYAKVRAQFGRPIGAFQAIQHKLANCHIALQGSRLSFESAAAARDSGQATWQFLAAAADVFAADALRRVILEVHHTFGGIGYSEEHEAPRHFREIHLDAVRFGGSRAAEDTLAAHFSDGGSAARVGEFPPYDLGPVAEAFRGEVRAWLADHWSGTRKAAHDALTFHERRHDAAFAREIGTTGWLGLTWAPEFGGAGKDVFTRLALLEELSRVDAPRVGAPVHAVTIQLHGTPAQRARYLPEILAGEAIWGIGYSEPESGSDLSSLKTTAVRDGDEWVINGEKIWTSTYWGEYMFVATRTDPAAPKHKGISVFIVPTDTKGLTFRPTKTLYGGEFANVRYEDVRLPADALLGAENDGWRVIGSALATERAIVSFEIMMPMLQAFTELCQQLRQPADDGTRPAADPLVRSKIARMAAELEVGRRLSLHCVQTAASNGETPPAEAAVSKVFAGELMERLGELSVDLLGLPGLVTEGNPGAVLDGRPEQRLRHSLMYVISLGTNEIQRNVIAQAGLRLPR